MANIKSAKKRALTNEARRQRNVQRRSDIKTAVKKVMSAIASNDLVTAQEMLKDAESKIARARGKGVLKRNTASRKISMIARKVAAAVRGTESTVAA
jgi:small subunit ribosomal protein S20